ncbi:MAG TPA: 2,5-diamino-6-(ribosylamino)-4(3H)-pyrimidinone 5'-phosphate reductase [Nitrososphaeraceae archaeon]|nr:2,5-diamino-6-(ribosylamino)-4(3H)-pyrimidinone 5'-phosphate reductase [Nitrososphaeraceae archaeon]
MYHNPWLKINAAMTIDGKIATVSGDSKISSTEDLRRVHKMRLSVDAIMVGISTVLVDNPMLSVRLSKTFGIDPVRIIIDSTARIPLTSKILRTAHNSITIVAVTNRARAGRIKKIQERGAMVIVAGTCVVDLRNVLSVAHSIGIRTILVEGGGELNWSLLRQGLVSELIVTIAPVLVGGRTATTLVEGKGYRHICKAAKMILRNVTRHRNGEVVLHYASQSEE